MANPDVRNALKVKGRLCWEPSSLATAYPHGGTALGLTKGMAVTFRQTAHTITAEEFGGAPVEAIYAGQEIVLSAILASWDFDAIALGFVDQSTGATTGRKVIEYRVQTDDKRAGGKVSTLAGILYFSPVADQHPGVLFHRALPMQQEGASLTMTLAEDWGFPFQWTAAPNEDGEICSVGLREDLTL